GMKSTTAHLQWLTEYFGAPEPMKVHSEQSPSECLRDTSLRFGTMKMAHGKAFSVGNPARTSARESSPAPPRSESVSEQGRPIPVFKSWNALEDGRKILTEEVRYSEIAPQLKKLTSGTSSARTGSLPASVS